MLAFGWMKNKKSHRNPQKNRDMQHAISHTNTWTGNEGNRPDHRDEWSRLHFKRGFHHLAQFGLLSEPDQPSV
jgi:hypothetical protein